MNQKIVFIWLKYATRHNLIKYFRVKGVLNDYQIFLEKFPELSAEPVVPESIWRSTVVEEVDMHNYEHIANGPGNGNFEKKTVTPLQINFSNNLYIWYRS